MQMSQIKKAWPVIIQNIDDVPKAFQKYFEFYSGGDFPYVIYDPAERSFANRTKAKVVCVLEDEVRVYEKEKSQPKETCIQVKNINYVESGTILLFSWITVNVREGNRTLNFTFTFNSSYDQLYKPFIDRLRGRCPQNGSAAAAAALEAEEKKFSFLITQNFKFMNLGRKSIGPGEEVEQILFQQEIKVQYMKLFGKAFYKSLLKTSLVILTNTELILIREPEGTRVKFGGVKWFIQLGKIKYVNAQVQADFKKCIVVIEFYDENHLQLELEDSKYGEMTGLLENLKAQQARTDRQLSSV